MSLPPLADQIISFRLLRRRLLRWRIIAVLAIICALLALFWTNEEWQKQEDHVARIHIEGTITGDAPTLALLKQLAAAEQVKAVMIHIDSPGGTTAGSEAIYENIRVLAKKKPVVSVMDTVAASGGYITAIATDYIVARENTITGSIGVVFSFPEVSELMGKIGIKMEEIKSGELKAEPTPFKPVPDRVRQVTQEMVMVSYQWFVGLVSERRKIPLEQTKLLADGRVYLGSQALTAKLIDAIGGEDKAVDWLVGNKNIASTLPIIDWKPAESSEDSGFGLQVLDMLLQTIGVNISTKQLETTRLDGLLVLWQPYH